MMKSCQVWNDPKPYAGIDAYSLQYAISFPRGNQYDIRYSELPAIVASLRADGWDVQILSNCPEGL